MEGSLKKKIFKSKQHCAMECIFVSFVSYSESHKGYKILYTDTNKVTIHRSVRINETPMCQKPNEVTKSATIEPNLSKKLTNTAKKRNKTSLK